MVRALACRKLAFYYPAVTSVTAIALPNMDTEMLDISVMD
jgi:hypothetical protein